VINDNNGLNNIISFLANYSVAWIKSISEVNEETIFQANNKLLIIIPNSITNLRSINCKVCSIESNSIPNSKRFNYLYKFK
jgi:hypothetical protein